ncbi:hypothetical protein MNV49_005446 [Pseudohyphozyma bogoriensis]|nr:hypothetical protein MNV49_005446 [Pseudohyphozyma bogoriensis]
MSTSRARFDSASPATGSDTEGPPNKKPRFARIRNACVRCKSRKQKCDLQLPRCSNCQKANKECVASTSVGGDLEDLPRDYAATLQGRVKELEEALRQARPLGADSDTAPRPGQPQGPNNGMESATLVHASLRFAAGHAVDAAGVASGAPSTGAARSTTLLPKPARRHPLPSLSTAQQLVESFFSNRWPNYPIFSYSRFQADVFRPVSEFGTLADDASLFIVYMVLAVGTLDQSHGEDGMATAYAYYNTATTFHLEALLANDNIQTLQGLLLLTIFALSDPRSVSLWHVVGIIMRIPVSIADEEITTSLPSAPDDPYLPATELNEGTIPNISAFIHTLQLRRLNGLIQCHLVRPQYTTFQDEFSNPWLDPARRPHSHSLMLLYRSSLVPGGTPLDSDLETCAEASTNLIRSYLRLYSVSKTAPKPQTKDFVRSPRQHGKFLLLTSNHI